MIPSIYWELGSFLNEIGEYGTAGYYFECGVDSQEIADLEPPEVMRAATPEQKREKKREKNRVGKSAVYVVYALGEVVRASIAQLNFPHALLALQVSCMCSLRRA